MKASRIAARLYAYALALLCLVSAPTASAQAPAFSYQGRLTDNGLPANGAFDLRFILYDAPISGAQQGPIVTLEDVTVANGIFTVTLDFGAAAFPGAARFLEISVRPGASTGAFTLLTPRQPVNATPYAVRSLNAGNADMATNATTAVNFSGALAGDVTGTQGATQLANNAVTTAKLADGSVTNAKIVSLDGGKITGTLPVASLPAGSGSYVQNTTTQQTTSNFNISGDGTAGGTLSGNAVNAVTQYNLGGQRVLSATGTNTFNTFVGLSAGAANTTGGANVFVGQGAGQANNTGGSNTFVGRFAGAANSTGAFNTFVGHQAGIGNTTACCNSFFGNGAGGANQTGEGNAFFGGLAGGGNTSGGSNAFFGSFAGQANIDGRENTFLGSLAGRSNTGGGQLCAVCGPGGVPSFLGSHNVFVGVQAGYSNTTANDNSFLGRAAGRSNTIGNDNSFFGQAAGYSNTTGYDNSFFGSEAGAANMTGRNNTLVGTQAEVGAGSLINATALGSQARVDCSNCLVLGSIAGINSASTSSNIGIGTPAPATNLEVVNNGGSAAHVFTTSYGAVNNAIIGRQAGGTRTSPSASANGLSLLFLGGRGHTGADFATVSRVGVNMEAAEDWTTTANGTRITFDTTENGTTSRVERMRIDDDGNVGIGTTSPTRKLSVAADNNSIGAIRGVSTGTNGIAVEGVANSGSTAAGIYGISSSGYAGYFGGDVVVTGTLSKGAGAFKIDHPLDPANKYLYHSFVESPDMKNIYDGNVTTDAAGLAEITLPDWFEALNRDFRYQLTVLGQFAQAIIAEKIKDNRFKIRTSLPHVEVSWQVTGIRKDAFAEKHRIPVEEDKPEKERGSYLHPAVFDQPEEKGVDWVRWPEMMRGMKERRAQAKQPTPPQPDRDNP